MKTRLLAPLSWIQIGLAIVPGLVALLLRSPSIEILGLSVRGGGYVYNSLVVVSGLLIIVGLLWKRGFIPWMFPAVGILLMMFPGLVFDLLFPSSGPRPATFDMLVNLCPVAAWAVSIVIVWQCRRDTSVSKLGWVLLGLVMTVGLIQGGAIMFLFMMGLVVLPVAVGLMFARRHRLVAGLVPVAGLYWLVDSVFDPSYSSSFGTLIEMTLALFFLVVPPIWVLCSRSARGRLWALLLPPGFALISSEIIRSPVFRGTLMPYSPRMWLTRGLGVVQFLLVLSLAAVIYQAVKSHSDSSLVGELSSAA